MCVSDASCNENRTAGNPHAVSNQNAGIGDSAYSHTQSIGDGVTYYPSYRVPIENRTGGTDAPTGAQRPNPAQPAGYHNTRAQGRTGGKLPAFRRGPVPPPGSQGRREGPRVSPASAASRAPSRSATRIRFVGA